MNIKKEKLVLTSLLSLTFIVYGFIGYLFSTKEEWVYGNMALNFIGLGFSIMLVTGTIYFIKRLKI